MADMNTPDDPPEGHRHRSRNCLPALSMALSLLLHVAVAAAALTMAMDRMQPDLETVYTVDLVAPGPRAADPVPEPLAAPKIIPDIGPDIGPNIGPDIAPDIAPQAAPSPAPIPEPQAQILVPQQPLPQPPTAPESVPPETARPAPDATTISPRTPPPPAPIAGITGPALPGVVVSEEGVLVGGLRGFAGMADTFALEQVGADVFTEEEYTGHYVTRDGRHIDVVDARQSEDMLILHRPKSGPHKGLVRGLTRYGKMIYTHGNGLHRHSPVDGTIYLLPKKARYNDENIDVPNQLMWMPAVPPMLYAEKVHILERDVSFESGGHTLNGIMAWVGHQPRTGAVLALAGCPPRSAMTALARRFALYGLAVLAFTPRGCDQDAAQRDTALPDRAADVTAAVRHLRGLPETDPGRVGVVGLGAGAAWALKAAADPAVAFAVMTCPTGAADPGRCALPVPGVADLLRARAPLCWLLPPAGPERWTPLREMLWRTGVADDAVRILPDPVPEGAEPDEARRLQSLDHAPARETAAWAAALP